MKNLKRKKLKKLRVAIIADEIQYWGGAQDDIVAFSEIFPNSTIYTSIYEQDILDKHFEGYEVKASFIQKMPFEKRLREEYFLFYPLAFKMFNFRNYDLVISVSSAFAKFVRPPKNVKHFLYCLTPPRYLWLDTRSDRSRGKFTYSFYSIFKPILHFFWKKQDRKAALRANMIATNSNEVAKRVKEFYDLNPKVLYPPVDTEYIEYNPDYKSRKDWFLYVGRVEKYKGVDLMVKACIEAKKKVKIAGKGSYLDDLKKLVHDLDGEEYVEFLGYVENEVKAKLLFDCKGLIFPVKDEDFGIVPIEANAAGCPVLAFAGGGVLETVQDGVTGKFFREYTVNSLAEELKRWEEHDFNPQDCKEQSLKFSFDVFESKMLRLVDGLIQDEE
jgi:glycosyltransferase involved in cell wall biosynthesis